MNDREILAHVDHTLLRVDATWDQIQTILDEAISYQTASACIPPSYVARAKDYVQDQMCICTVIGFPNGYSTTETKCFEAADAVANGADEIDMVIPIGLVKDGQFDQILTEINQVKKSCDGHLLKVIIETCLLTEEEILRMCEIVSESDADYIKTSTGFSVEGATKDVVRLMVSHVTNGTKVKAAGGIASLSDAAEYLGIGADRLGTSRVVAEVMRQ